MKINIEFDITPAELRQFMGLPDVRGLQDQWVERMASDLESSREQQERFFRSVFAQAIGPWQGWFNPAAGAAANVADEDET